MNHFKIFLTFSIFFLFLISSVDAGIYIHSIGQFKDMNKTDHTKLFIEKDRLRLENISGSENNVIIFREDKGVFWMINPDEKTYSEMTREDLEKLKSQMNDAFKQMEEQLKNLPPEQRKMMEKMMPEQAQMAMQKPTKTMYKKKASGEKVNQWTCTHYEGFVEGKKTKDMWTTDFSELNIDTDDLKGLQAMGKFFEVLSKETEELFMIGSDMQDQEGSFSGMPVKTIEYKSGVVYETSELKEIKNKSFDSTIFDLPPGFKKEKKAWGM